MSVDQAPRPPLASRRPGSPIAVPARALVAAVRAYRRYVSPVLGQHCRFHPTCSRYAVQALASHGALRGGWLTLKRVARCHPLHPGGVDPVPDVPFPREADAARRQARPCLVRKLVSFVGLRFPRLPRRGN